MKKIIATVLSLVMIISICPFGLFSITASAESVTKGYCTYYIDTWNNTASLTGADKSISGHITIPSKINGYPVTSIGYGAFQDCIRLTGITIPSSIKSISGSAFEKCVSLKDVYITDLVAWCKIGFETYNSYSNPLCYAKNFYVNGYKIANLTIPNGVKKISSGAFRGYKSLTSVTIPNSVEEIGDRAFYECKGLTSVTIPNSVKKIGDRAFYECDELKKVTIPNSVTQIGDYAFYDCDGLTSVTISNGVKEIGDCAFEWCSGLKKVTIPGSVDLVGEYAFAYCDELTEVVIKEGVVGIDESAFRSSDLCSITLPKSLLFIADEAFFNYSYYLKNVWFTGSKSDRNQINIGADNSQLENATWHYNTCVGEHTYSNSKDGTCNKCEFVRASITKQTANAVVYNGDVAEVEITAAGEGLKYQWYYKESWGKNFALTENCTGNTYVVLMSDIRNGRQVYCVVTDIYGNKAQSNTVTLKKKITATIKKQPVSVSNFSGKTVTATVGATGDGLTYKWYYKNKGESKFTYTSTFKGNTYTTTMNATRAGRQIYCLITDKYGNSVKTNTVTLGMKNTAKITKWPQNATALNGKNVTVTVGATGDGHTYKWYFKDKGVKSFAYTPTFTGNTYSTTMTAARNGRQLYCVVTDKYGNKVKTNTVTIGMKTPAKIKYSPANAYVKQNANAKFSITASGDGLKYQWQVKTSASAAWKNTTITGYNTKTITVPATAARKGYKYRCIVTDKYGNKVTSGTATLYIN